MCGINGFISKKKIAGANERIENMNNSLIHRGPDAEGQIYLEEENLALGHRRLAIIDLDKRANQPFFSKNGKNILVYNGEIYNYRELKRKMNCSFETESDTEVLMNGLSINGIDWIKECNGMFAFAFYDIGQKALIVCRDRLGIKPLYYYYDGEKFIFSSEIKGILNSGLVEAELYEPAIDEYLGNRYVREPYTFFKKIYMLPAGCYMVIDERLNISIQRYWELPREFNCQKRYDENEIYYIFREKLENSIYYRMEADVPVGTYLSGGIDSSIISAIASQKARNVNTYTVGFNEMNEFDYASLVSEMYGTKHHTILMDKRNYLEMIKEIIGYKDAPLGVPNEIPLAVMSKELKKDITVVLSGEGADELLGGYGRIFRAPFDFHNVDRKSRDSFYDYFINKYEYVPRFIRDKFLGSSKYELRELFDEKVRKSFQDSSDEEAIFRFFHTFHVKGLLQRVDTTTMLASVEARVPFLDHELVEFCYKEVPYDLKLRWNSIKDRECARRLHSYQYSENMDQPKYLLRRLGREILPTKVVDRKKMGFPVPLNVWFAELEDMAIELLTEASWLRRNSISQLCDECKKSERYGQILWMFLNFEIFRRMYFEKEWRY